MKLFTKFNVCAKLLTLVQMRAEHPQIATIEFDHGRPVVNGQTERICAQQFGFDKGKARMKQVFP